MEVRKEKRRASDKTKEREFTDLGLDWSKRQEQVACHASALTLVMADEACREAEM